jgi:hypothetical protein
VAVESSRHFIKGRRHVLLGLVESA